MGDLANAVETTSLASGGGGDGEKEEEVVIDWKRAYRNLSRVTARIKTLVVQAGMHGCVHAHSV